MSGGFQQLAYNAPVVAFAGDFASANPYFTYDAGPGGLVAGASGVVIGRFAWTAPPVDGDGTPSVVNNAGAGIVAGFVHREQQGLNPTYLSNAGVTIQRGFGVTLCIGGDFWAVNDGSTQALVGQKVYADLATGKASAAATGSPTQAASVTASVAASTGSFTGSITNDLLTITAVGSGVAVAGGTLSGTGVKTGTQIVAQLTPLLAGEATGGIGRYNVSIPNQSTASVTISETYGTMTVSAVGSGAIALGAAIAGSGVVAGTTVTQFGTGTGGTGTYIVNNNTVVGSTTVTSVGNVETKWYVTSNALPGGLMKMSDHAPG